MVAATLNHEHHDAFPGSTRERGGVGGFDDERVTIESDMAVSIARRVNNDGLESRGEEN